MRKVVDCRRLFARMLFRAIRLKTAAVVTNAMQQGQIALRNARHSCSAACTHPSNPPFGRFWGVSFRPKADPQLSRHRAGNRPTSKVIYLCVNLDSSSCVEQDAQIKPLENLQVLPPRPRFDHAFFVSFLTPKMMVMEAELADFLPKAAIF